MDNPVQVVRATGRIGIVDVHVPEDPGATNERAKEGRIAFDYGAMSTKGVTPAGVGAR